MFDFNMIQFKLLINKTNIPIYQRNYFFKLNYEKINWLYFKCTNSNDIGA